VPVRYDPDDRSKAVIDMPALEAAHARQIVDAKTTLQRCEDERIARGAGRDRRGRRSRAQTPALSRGTRPGRIRTIPDR
jgi:hypothetical protein